MCACVRERSEMSRVSNRASTAAATFAIVLLVILLVMLWTSAWTTDRIEAVGRYQRDNVSQVERFEEFRPLGSTGRDDRGSVFTFAGPEVTSSTTHDRNFTNEVPPVVEIPKVEIPKPTFNHTTIDVPKLKDGEIEYIGLMKLSQNVYEDPPDESSTGQRHHSGHFRHLDAEIWDPHPQYEFTAFGQKFLLQLAHDTSFVGPDIKVTRMGENTTTREHPGNQLGCFYTGYVAGDPMSAVSVSLCHGMTGHMKTSSGSYFIKPTEHWQGVDKETPESTLRHAVHRVSASSSRPRSYDTPPEAAGNGNCGVSDYDREDAPAPLTDDSSGGKVYVGERRSRQRRSLTAKTSLDRSIEASNEEEAENAAYEQFVGQSEYHRNLVRNDNRYDRYYSVERKGTSSMEEYRNDMQPDPFVTWRPRRALPRQYFIEIMVVADATMKNYHQGSLVNYILTLMSTVSQLYKEPSIGNPISIAVVHVVETDEIFGSQNVSGDGIAAGAVLKQFCQWQYQNNPAKGSPAHHDTALLLTRENLCHNSVAKSCDTLGLAELSTMCNAQNSCAIVQDNGLAASFTIAHEIGHVLSMPHDDDSKCSSFRNRSDPHNVMSRMLDDNTFPWEWSNCSKHFVTEFLEAGQGDCLLDVPEKIMEKDEPARLPGEDYSKNEQCELVYGPGSRICPHMVSDVCRTLWCTAPWDHRNQCHTLHMPWGEGTACDYGKWCRRGECVPRRNLEPIHGEWGEWKQYGECSRTCGGGIRKKYRECDSPRPQNGGNYCVGMSVKYRSCNTKECPPGSPDFREQQCSKFDNNNLNIQNLTRDVKWHAKYTNLPPKDRCRLHCYVQSNQYYKLREKVIDGTPCSPDTFHICVNGHCKSAGCDHVLNSTAELDTCGVCKGDNSTCQRITGSYNASIYGYTRVTKIPAGSSYIDVRQHGWMDSHNDSNYLALRLGEGGEYILNGNFMVMHQKVIVHPDVTIEYSGPELVVERLNSSRPTNIDLILEVLSAGEVHPPQIVYEYTVPKKFLENHMWILSNWTECNRMCQGMRYRKAECRSTEHKDVVSDDYCSTQEKPREESDMCNMQCTLKWETTSRSECSNHCGPGTRKVQSRCFRISSFNIRSIHTIPDHACSHLERPSHLEACMGPCDKAHWRYGEWEPCSVTCGGGSQIRSATCVDFLNGRIVAEENCVGHEKKLWKPCSTVPCPKWDLGEWSKCSVTCGKGVRERSYWCREGNRVVQNSYCGALPTNVMETCDAGPCHQWHAGPWSQCPVTCGEGMLRRKVTCKSIDGSPSDKCPPSEKPEDAVPCVQMPCPIVANVPITYSRDAPHEDLSQQDNEIDSNGITFRSGYKWWKGAYSECTKSCNGGLTRRNVKCASTETGVTVSDHYCDRRHRPAETVSCNTHPCPVWDTGAWGQCDSPCGHGFQRRQVRCRNYIGDLVSDKECSGVGKPRHMKRCQKGPCTTPSVHKYNAETSIVRRWRTSNWTPCSKSCGNGIKTRRVECTMRRGNHGPELPVKDEHCSKYGLSRPKSQRFCQRAPCEHTWQEGPWSECSAKCGEGIQHRTVSCHRVNDYGWVDPAPSDGCSISQKPATEQTCKLRDCGDEFYWTFGPWRSCSHPCGRKGRQIRRLFCNDVNGGRVARTKCPQKSKPQRKRKCNQKRCGPSSCLEAQRRFKNTSDGEYSLIIGGRSMSIYCYRMATAEPREYLTLPAGGQENYAEIYDKRLINSHTCPFNGQRNDSCHCYTELNNISGRTMFERVRINTTKLHIIPNDYTFSRTTGESRVEFGKAGDCYSRANCPQGRFSINLRGTMLRLSSDATWVPKTQTTVLAINRINDQRIVGKCGGYCGFCEPKTDLKLDVLPP